MSKNIITKALLVLVLITLSAALLTGCSLFSTTVTVKLTGSTAALAETYNIYVDDEFEDEMAGTGSLEITGLSKGEYTFKAESTTTDKYGEKIKNVTGLWAPTVKIPVE